LRRARRSRVAEIKDGVVKFALAGKDLWQRSNRLRAGPETHPFRPCPGAPERVAGVRDFGRYRSGAIRDGVLLSVSCA